MMWIFSISHFLPVSAEVLTAAGSPQQTYVKNIQTRRIVVVDSLAATLGQGLLVYKAVQLKEAEKNLDEIAAWLEENKYHLVHNFTVDDLFHLHRGGRLSKTAAIVGTMINLKPVLHVDDEGHLVMLSKVRGRKKSLIGLVDCMEKQLG